MADDRFSQALSRIEAAAVAIEMLLDTPGADPALAERHLRLRAGTAAAMARLDHLIEIAEAHDVGSQGD